MDEKKTRTVFVGGVPVGGGNAVSVQSMTNTDTRDAAATVAQIHALEAAGCDIVRVAVPDEAAARAIAQVKREIHIPLVADIHFDYRLALLCMENGVDKVRINPGNIGDQSKVRAVCDMAKEKHIPIRIGVNGGSLEKHLLQKYGAPTAQALVESALAHAALLEECGFYDIVLSLKASDVPTMIEAYRLAHEACDYPLHLGVTEAGTYESGIVKSAVGIGTLLSSGIGDTIRVSLTDDPVREVSAGIEILKSLGLRRSGVTFVSCPTCGRCQIDLIGIANEVYKRVKHLDKDIKIAVMGCAVNGPGEARDADIGIAGGDGIGLLFKKGEIVRRVPQEEIVDTLMQEIEQF
ncbi:MAG TPA: flavodoxin-dependent (E)-4-hydroxy-3-methylbut-2-enyl-diphosphate synthase [Candidatus Aphodoplasma excrementigallinarum]|uniref:4-hydroxy-3-methylbut-2-en-1-yl diphosphate synthase (flavodoxin) n=1 Tax=Candidatus Aphodoplasma excrementigallinarum TaxID=2840673 RepID=A0A9D1SZ26_9FIRM|nr:flavodoxin-dependent (E)-4-hydroxy-3-methylbut-2-enyl-diphosphate synthase [Candidatus Aphodoplasma excrementigallinarum]